MSNQQQELAQKLKQAHTEFLLSRLQGEGLIATIDRELDAVFTWGETVSLNEIVDRELLIKSILRIVETGPFNEELRGIVVRSVIMAIQSELNDGANVKNLVPKNEYDKTVTHFAQFEKLRMDVIRMVLESPIYSELISDVLYHGIKDYVLTENAVVKKVPGVSSLMKAGAKTLNKAMPKLEAAAEGTIKKFISNNLKSTVELSEKILNNALSESNIRSIADHFWGTISEKDFSKFKGYVNEADVNETVEIGNGLWVEVRQAEYLQNMIGKVIEHVLDDIGDRKLAELVTAIGYGKDYLASELKQILPGTLENKVLMDYLESRIQSDLDEFYASEGFSGALS